MTSPPRPDRPPARGPSWRYAVAAVAAAAALAAGAVLGRHTLAESLDTFGRLDWTWFLAALGCEGMSLTAFGLKRRRLLQADGHRATLRSVMAITYASNALSMSVPFAGAQLAMVFSYREFRRRGLSPALTGWALAVSAIMSASALALVLVTGAVAGGASLAAAAGLVGAAAFMLPALVVLAGLRYARLRAVLNQVLARLIRASRRLVRWPPAGAEGALEDTLARVATIRLPGPRYAEVFCLAVVNWVADSACLACAILATGQPVPWHGLLLAYAAGAVVGSTGLTPGGFALVEATLTAALVAAGMGTAPALAAVLAYRLLSFWMILIGGWALVVMLSRARSRSEVYPRSADPA